MTSNEDVHFLGSERNIRNIEQQRANREKSKTEGSVG